MNLEEKYGNEKVLVVEKSNYESWLSQTDNEIEALSKSVQHHGFWMLRSQVESDTSLRQVIPYVVLKCGSKYFITKRIDGDARLNGQYSFCVGGHVDLEDRVSGTGVYNIHSFDKTILNCIVRELREETTIDEDIKYDEVCCFTDDSTDVSKVHICYLVVVKIKHEVDIRETDKLSGEWLSAEQVLDLKEQGVFENWSNIAIERLGLKKPKTRKRKKVSEC